MATLEELFSRRMGKKNPSLDVTKVSAKQGSIGSLVDPLTATLYGTSFSPVGQVGPRLISRQAETEGIELPVENNQSFQTGMGVLKRIEDQGALQSTESELGNILGLEKAVTQQKFGAPKETPQLLDVRAKAQKSPGAGLYGNTATPSTNSFFPAGYGLGRLSLDNLFSLIQQLGGRDGIFRQY